MKSSQSIPQRLVPVSSLALGVVILFGLAGPARADLDILVVGSTHSYSENKQPGGMTAEKPFNVSAVADELRKILSKDRAVREPVNVVFQDVFATKQVHTDVGGWKTPGFRYGETEYKCHSLAQFFLWPDGKAKRLKTLRGEDGTAWDYVVITGDPYILAHFPGMYAAGVALVAGEVARGPAKPVLLAQWPAKDSATTAAEINEIVYRVGQSGGYAVVPAGKAWDRYRAKDTSADHPTAGGAYLAAACVYTEIFHRNAGSSGYNTNHPMARHAYVTVAANTRLAQYKGVYSKPNAFQMKYDGSRHVDFNHTGSSTENGFLGELEGAMNRCNVTHKRYGHPDKWPKELKQVNFNYGRANAMFEPRKRYDPANCNQGKNYYRRSYGFPMQDHAWSAKTSMEYGIDWRWLKGNKRSHYDDGTDLGIAVKMLQDGSVERDVRCLPMHLLVARCRHLKPELPIQFDTWHYAAWGDEAAGTFMYTLQSGRCPMTDEPGKKDSPEWNKWLGRRIGYETAWQLSHLTTRAPGFQVIPKSKGPALAPDAKDPVSVRFMLPPRAEVTVGVFVDDANALDVSPTRLTFTPDNCGQAQTVTVTAKAGLAGKTARVRFETRSNDPVYQRLQDVWEYEGKVK